MRRAILVGIATIIACQCNGPIAYGEALLVVDTDLPVPRVVNHLRVDVYTDGLRWIATRDISEPNRERWPMSFSVYAPNDVDVHHAIVRLRAYGEGYVRRYRGESLVDKPPLPDDKTRFDPAPIEPHKPFADQCVDCPRLISTDPKTCGDAKTPCDITPPNEPTLVL